MDLKTNEQGSAGTAVIFGGTGFIGLNLTGYLLKNKWKVIAMDTGETSSDAVLSLFDQHYKMFREAGLWKIIPFDIRDSDQTMWQKIFNMRNLTRVYNLACPASPPFYQADPFGTLDSCYGGTWNILRAWKKYGDMKQNVFHASTSEVYGDPLQHPQQEDYFGNVNTYGPRACYDEGKRVAETICYEYQKLAENAEGKLRVGRIFNTYGPYMRPDDGRVVTNFITRALLDQDLEIYCKSPLESPTRSLCYVDDLLYMIEKMMSSKGVNVGPTNIGNPSGEISIVELAERIVQYTGSKSKITFTERPQDDPKLRKPWIIKYESLYGGKKDFMPHHDGLHHTIKYLERYKKCVGTLP